MAETKGNTTPRTVDVPSSEVELGEKIYRWRRDRGWTQSDLADRAGVARSTLSKIENGLLSPTFEILLKISRGFGMGIAEFLAPEEQDGLRGRLSIDRGDASTLMEYPNHRLHPLAGQLKGRKFDSFVVEFTCRNLEEFGEWNTHETEDMLYVLSGTLEFHSEGYEPFRLEPGHSVQFDGRMRHACLSVGKSTCRCLYVCSS